jgi:acyl-homoserine-lactone acylase
MALDPAKYPDYMAPRSMSFRAQRSARMLDEDASVTFDELVAYKHSTRMELADRLLDDVLTTAAKSPSEKVRRAGATLAAWDRSTDASSRGAVLFETFFNTLARGARPRSPFGTRWSETAPRTTPDGLADPDAALRALESAVADLEGRGLGPDVPWGDVYRLRRDGLDLPGNGGPGSLGIFRVTGFAKGEDGRFEALGGDSWVAAIEFSQPVRAEVLLGYGNWSQKGSSHRTDQLALYASKQLRPAWRTRADVERHLERGETLQYSLR